MLFYSFEVFMKKNIFFILSVFLFFSCEKKLSNSDVEYVQQNIKPFTDINDFSFEVSYPHFKNYPLINDEIQKILDYASLLANEIALSKTYYTSSMPDTSTWFVSLSSEEPEIVGMTISILFYLSRYNGITKPFTEVISVNYDAEDNKILTIENISQLEHTDVLNTISKFCIKELEKKYIDDNDFNSDIQWIHDGAAAQIKNYETFRIQKKGIEVIFSPCQVATQDTGIVRVHVPYTVLKK